jgi:hypothetical protein
MGSNGGRQQGVLLPPLVLTTTCANDLAPLFEEQAAGGLRAARPGFRGALPLSLPAFLLSLFLSSPILSLSQRAR